MKTTLTAFVPAHKQTNPEHKPGQIVNPLGMTIQSSEKTLAEYIQRKTRQEAFDTVAQEKTLVAETAPKLSFDEWYEKEGWKDIHTRTMSLDDADSARYIMYVAWWAGRNNA